MTYSKAEQAVLGEFGRRVRSAREAHGWSQEQLAEKAHLDRTYIGGVERGERNWALLNVNKFAVALDDGFDEFLPHRTTRRRRSWVLSRARRRIGAKATSKYAMDCDYFKRRVRKFGQATSIPLEK